MSAPVPLPEVGFGFPRDVSAEGWRIDRIIEVATYPITVLGVIAIGWLLYAAVAHRRAPARYTTGDTRMARLVPLAIATLLFVVVDGYLLVRSTIDLGEVYQRTAEIADEPDAVHIEINARQWAWDVRYPGADGVFATPDDLVLASELRVPVDRPVVVELAASDVVHALYLPNLRIKRDAIPGQITALWFRATETGAFEIACAQHCGVGHYKMRGVLHVMSADDFATWQAAAAAEAKHAEIEDARARADEPSRAPVGAPFKRPAPSRDWGWAWSTGERR